MTNPQPLSAEQTLRMLRVVFLGIMSGLLVFAGAAVLIVFADPESTPRVSFSATRLLVFSWTCLTVVLSVVAYRMARAVTEPLSSADAASLVASEGITLARLRSRLIL